MLTDRDIAQAIGALYETRPQGFAVVEETAGIVWGLRHNDEADLIICRGSESWQDYLRDGLSELARALPGYPALGLLPSGFSTGLVRTYPVIAAFLRPDHPTLWAGHSLGAAHATALAGMHKLHGGAISRLMLCGSPLPGMTALADLLAYVPTASYRNAGDAVYSVPFPVPGLLPWRHLLPAPIGLTVAAAPGDDGFFAHHHWSLYAALGADLLNAPDAHDHLRDPPPNR